MVKKFLFIEIPSKVTFYVTNSIHICEIGNDLEKFLKCPRMRFNNRSIKFHEPFPTTIDELGDLFENKEACRGNRKKVSEDIFFSSQRNYDFCWLFFTIFSINSFVRQCRGNKNIPNKRVCFFGNISRISSSNCLPVQCTFPLQWP